MGDDQSRRLLESNLLKILPPGEYVDPHWLQTMHSAGITYPDVNLIRALTENKTGRKNGAAEYLHLRKKLPRKGTQYDNELYSYPYQYKQLHADHADAGYGNHYDIEMPELDEVLLTDETTENVFRKNRHASDAAVKKCISDAFFAGEVKAGDLLVKAAVGSDFIRPTADMDNMITPLFKTVITAGLKKSDTEHRVNRHAQPAIIANNDFRRKKNLSKSMDAQIHTLKSNSRKLHSQQRQIVDVKNSGNFWRLTQRRLFSRASSRDGSPRGRSRPVSVGQHADTGAAVVEHFPMPIKDEREWREARKQISITKNSMGTESLVSEITHFSRELSSDAVAQAVVRLEGAGAFASVDEYSDDFHTVSDIKPFSDGAVSIISLHADCVSVLLDDSLKKSPYPHSVPNIDKCSIDASASSIAYSSRPISLLQDLDSEEEDDYDSDEEEAVAQARLEVFKNRIRAVAPAGSLPVTGPRMSVLAANKIVAMPIGHRGHKELKTRATIVRNVHKKHVGEGDVSIHDDDGDFLVPDQGNIMNSKPKVYIPFSKLAEEDDRSDEDEEEASPKKPGVPVFSPPKPKTDSPEPTKSPSAPSVSRKMSARPQSAPVTLASRRMSGASNGNQGPEVSGGGANCDGPVTSSSRSDEALVQIPLNSRASTAGRRTSMYAPNIQKTDSIQYAKPSFGLGDKDDELGLSDYSDIIETPQANADEPLQVNDQAELQEDDINPEDYDNINEWLAVQMQALINDVNHPKDKPKKELKPKRVLAGEIAVLFKGFQTIDRYSLDCLISLSDLRKYCTQFKVPLKKKDLEFYIWLMDDNRKGFLTFEDIKTCYIDQRKRKKYFSIKSDETKALDSKRPATERKSDYAFFSPRKNRTKIANPKSSPQGPASMLSSHFTTPALLSDPIVLFRLLFFAATQDSQGNVRLMSAYQHYSQLYATLADERFLFVYQKDTSSLEDADIMHVAELIRKTTIITPYQR